jgi:hypothetical protein
LPALSIELQDLLDAAAALTDAQHILSKKVSGVVAWAQGLCREKSSIAPVATDGDAAYTPFQH